MDRIVFSAVNEFEARLACDLLRAHHIPHRTSGSDLTGLKGVLPVSEASVVIEVLRDPDVERARALLVKVAGPHPESEAWICTRCQEETGLSYGIVGLRRGEDTEWRGVISSPRSWGRPLRRS